MAANATPKAPRQASPSRAPRRAGLGGDPPAGDQHQRSAQAAARCRSWTTASTATPHCAHLVEHAEELELVADVEVGGGLVEQQDLRLLREAARQRRELPLAGGERAERAARPGPRCPVCCERARDRLRRPRGERRGTARGAGSGPAPRAPRTVSGAGAVVLRRHERQRARQRVARPVGERPAVAAAPRPLRAAAGRRARARASTCRRRSVRRARAPRRRAASRSTPCRTRARAAAHRRGRAPRATRRSPAPLARRAARPGSRARPRTR